MSQKLRIAMRDLNRVVEKFDPEQGRISRRNTRRKALELLRRVRLYIDDDYPVIKPANPPRRKKRKARADQMPNGWVRLFTAEAFTGSHERAKWMQALAKAGVTVRSHRGAVIVPDWVPAIGPYHTKLRKAQKDANYRKAQLAAKLLESLENP